MSLRYGVFCLLLSLVVLLLALKNYELWTRPIGGTLGEGEIRKAETKTEGSPILGSQKETASIASYIMIGEKNIFSPERKEFSITGLDQSKPMMRPQIILYGVTISKDYQSATIVNPGRPLRKGEREMTTLKIGDRVGEYKLAKILPDRITMEAGEDSFEVLLFDSSMPKRRTLTKTESKPAEITSTSPAPPPAPARRTKSSRSTQTRGASQGEGDRTTAPSTSDPRTGALSGNLSGKKADEALYTPGK